MGDMGWWGVPCRDSWRRAQCPAGPQVMRRCPVAGRHLEATAIADGQ